MLLKAQELKTFRANSIYCFQFVTSEDSTIYHGMLPHFSSRCSQQKGHFVKQKTDIKSKLKNPWKYDNIKATLGKSCYFVTQKIWIV